MNEERIIKDALKKFNRQFKKKSLLKLIKQHRCKTCEFVYRQGSIFACEHCEKWNGFKIIRPLKLICFSYKRRDNIDNKRTIRKNNK